MKSILRILAICAISLQFTPALAQKIGLHNPNPSKDVDIIGNVRIDKTNNNSTNPTLELRESGSATNFTRIKFTKPNFPNYWSIAVRPSDTTNIGRFNIYNPDLGNAFTIHDNGRVGINVNTPLAMLHINSTEGNDPFRVQRSGSTKFRIFDNSSISIGSNNESVTPGNVYIHTNLGLGVGAPTEKLDINGNIKTTGFILTDNPADGYVLTSDANGVGSWQANDASATNEAINLFTFASNIISIREGNNAIQQINLSALASDDNLGNHVADVNLNMNNKRITNLAAPVSAGDAATKAYVDGFGELSQQLESQRSTNAMLESRVQAQDATIADLMMRLEVLEARGK